MCMRYREVSDSVDLRNRALFKRYAGDFTPVVQVRPEENWIAASTMKDHEPRPMCCYVSLNSCNALVNVRETQRLRHGCIPRSNCRQLNYGCLVFGVDAPPALILVAPYSFLVVVDCALVAPSVLFLAW